MSRAVRRRRVMELDGWTFSWHALERAVDMAVPAEELRDVLAEPKATWQSDKYQGCQMRTNYRIILACDPEARAVITVLWYRGPGIPRFERTLEDDLKRIRDHDADGGTHH